MQINDTLLRNFLVFFFLVLSLFPWLLNSDFLSRCGFGFLFSPGLIVIECHRGIFQGNAPTKKKCHPLEILSLLEEDNWQCLIMKIFIGISPSLWRAVLHKSKQTEFIRAGLAICGWIFHFCCGQCHRGYLDPSVIWICHFWAFDLWARLSEAPFFASWNWIVDTDQGGCEKVGRCQT